MAQIHELEKQLMTAYKSTNDPTMKEIYKSKLEDVRGLQNTVVNAQVKTGMQREVAEQVDFQKTSKYDELPGVALKRGEVFSTYFPLSKTEGEYGISVVGSTKANIKGLFTLTDKAA